MTTLCGMEIHPAAERDPMCSTDELRRMTESIAKNGQRDPIIIDQFERVVDGRNRLLACEAAGVEPVFEPMQFATDAEAYAYNDDKNEHRRHLTAAQRAKRAAAMVTQQHGRPPKKVSRDTFSEAPVLEPVSVDEAAKSQGVSRESVLRASRVEKKGTPELQQAVDTEQISLKRAAEIAKLPPEQQVAEVEAAKAPKPKKPKADKPKSAPLPEPDEIVEPEPEEFELLHEQSAAMAAVRKAFSHWPMDYRDFEAAEVLRNLLSEDRKTW